MSGTRREFIGGAAAALSVRNVGLAEVHASVSASGAAANPDLTAHLSDAIKRFKVPGASVAFYRNGQVETAVAGVANISTGIPITSDTLMHIGSTTKLFTTTLVMQLVDEGLVDLDRPLVDYVPDFHIGRDAAARDITVKMLLNHTSGIDGEILPDYGPDQETIGQGVSRIEALRLLFRPGATLSYCNAGFVLAGYLVQRLRKESWYTVMKERILKPLGLLNSEVIPSDMLLHRATVGHFLDRTTKEIVRTTRMFLPLSYAPAGASAMLSSSDLLSFAVMHMKGGAAPDGTTIVSTRSAEQMRQATSTYKGVWQYPGGCGLGWLLTEDGGLAHSGGGPGIQANLYANPKIGIALAILVNAEHGGPVINEIQTALIGPGTGLGTDVHYTLAGSPPAMLDLKRYVGRYDTVSDAIDVIERDGALAIAFTSKFSVYDSTFVGRTPEIKMTPLDINTFAASAGREARPSYFVFFDPLADGRFEHIAVRGRVYRRDPTV